MDIKPDPADATRMILRAEQSFEAPIEKVFSFFSEAANLEDITPPWLNFRILTPQPIEMAQGTLIDYRLTLHWIPIRWRTEISEWHPPYQFVDRQLRGPYRLWRHTHTFEETDRGTHMTDIVEYSVPGGRLVNRLFVEPDLRVIFQYRQQRLAERFAVRECVTR